MWRGMEEHVRPHGRRRTTFPQHKLLPPPAAIALAFRDELRLWNETGVSIAPALAHDDPRQQTVPSVIRCELAALLSAYITGQFACTAKHGRGCQQTRRASAMATATAPPPSVGASQPPAPCITRNSKSAHYLMQNTQAEHNVLIWGPGGAPDTVPRPRRQLPPWPPRPCGKRLGVQMRRPLPPRRERPCRSRRFEGSRRLGPAAEPMISCT